MSKYEEFMSKHKEFSGLTGDGDRLYMSEDRGFVLVEADGSVWECDLGAYRIDALPADAVELQRPLCPDALAAIDRLWNVDEVTPLTDSIRTYWPELADALDELVGCGATTSASESAVVSLLRELLARIDRPLTGRDEHDQWLELLERARELLGQYEDGES